MIKEGIEICEGDGGVRSCVSCSENEWALLCLHLHSHEVLEPPVPLEKFVSECMFYEHDSAVRNCLCGVACCVTIVFDWCSWYTSSVQEKNIRVFLVMKVVYEVYEAS